METAVALWLLMGCTVQIEPGPGLPAAWCAPGYVHPGPIHVTKAQCMKAVEKPHKARQEHATTYVCISPDAKTIINQHGLKVIF